MRSHASIPAVWGCVRRKGHGLTDGKGIRGSRAEEEADKAAHGNESVWRELVLAEPSSRAPRDGTDLLLGMETKQEGAHRRSSVSVVRGVVFEEEDAVPGAPSQRKVRKHKLGRRVERFLGYCRFCDIELERNTTDPRKCDGGGFGSILGNSVVMVGVLAMAASVVIRKTGILDESAEGRQVKRALFDGSLLLLLVGWGCERLTRVWQSSCCCRCAETQRCISYYCRRTCRACKSRKDDGLKVTGGASASGPARSPRQALQRSTRGSETATAAEGT